MKRTPFKRRTRKAPKRPKLTSKGYSPPSWFNDIKPGGHGSTPAQKRLWRIVSEYVRERDFKLYGKCVSCPHRFTHWKEGQAGHWLPFSICHSWYKFDPQNIALQCEGCNMSLYRSGAHTGHEMGEELKRRHGPAILDTIKATNELYRGQKMEVWQIVAKVEELARLSTGQ